MEKWGYLDQLIADCEKAKTAHPIAKYTLRKDDGFHEIKGIRSAIYIIKQLDGDIVETFEKFAKFKLENKNLKCAKCNVSSEILYVGSSTTGLISRLKQHTQQCHKDTYALRLNDWFIGDYEIQVFVYAECIGKNILQLIEDNFAFHLKPAFGKMGANNK